MLKIVNGELFHTSFGKMIVLNEYVNVSTGEVIQCNGNDYYVKRMIAPSRPQAKWSIEVENMN